MDGCETTVILGLGPVRPIFMGEVLVSGRVDFLLTLVYIIRRYSMGFQGCQWLDFPFPEDYPPRARSHICFVCQSVSLICDLSWSMDCWKVGKHQASPELPEHLRYQWDHREASQQWYQWIHHRRYCAQWQRHMSWRGDVCFHDVWRLKNKQESLQSVQSTGISDNDWTFKIVTRCHR